MFIGMTAVLGLSGPAGWALIASGIAAVTVATLTMNKALGATEEVLSGDELQAKIKETKDRINELAEANGKYETQLKDLTPYKNFASEVDHLSSGFSLLEDKILPMPDLYDGVVQSMSKNSAESMLLKNELEQLELLYSNIAETVETETIPAIDEIVHNFKESQKVIGLNTDMLTKLGTEGFSPTTEMARTFYRVINVATGHLSHMQGVAFNVHEEMAKNFIPTISVATGHLSFMKKEVFSVHDEMSKNFIPTISVGTGMLTKMKNEGFSPTTEMAKVFNRVIQVSTAMLSHNLEPAVKSATDIMGEYKRSWKSSTEFLSHNAIPVDIRATDIMGKTFDALKKKTDALKAAAKAQKELTAVEEANYKTQFDAFKAGKFAEMDLTKLTEKQKLKFVKDGARTALGQLAQHNKAAFMINKAFAIKDAIVSTSQGVVKALSMGPLGIPLAMIIGAMGVAQIATIASQSYSGRRYGGPVSNDQSYIVGENGPEMFTPGATGRITANGSGSKKPVNINFNITATDASSIDELLVARRGMIINMVRQATQERGNQPNF